MSDSFLKTYYTGVVGNLECAIDLLSDLEYKVKCDGDSQLSDLVREQACIFFEHLIKNKSTLLIKDPDGMRITDIDDIKNNTLDLRPVETYGFFRYLPHLSKKVESRLLDVTMTGTTYFFDQIGTPPDASTPDTVVYLSDLSLDETDLAIYYGTDPGEDNDHQGPPDTTPGSYVVLDKDQIYTAICQLRNHYQSIVKYIDSLGHCGKEKTSASKDRDHVHRHAMNEVEGLVERLDKCPVKIGQCAGFINQDCTSVAVGCYAGFSNQDSNSVAIGNDAGRWAQCNASVAIGLSAGESNQSCNAVAIGTRAGQSNQSPYTVAVGFEAGYDPQSNDAIAIGTRAGRFNQGSNAIGIGKQAGAYNQSMSAVAVGPFSGTTSQGENAVAVGIASGQESQSNRAVAIGFVAGQSNQGYASVSIGSVAAQVDQGDKAIAMGFAAGQSNQCNYAVAIGHYAGRTSQGSNAIAIGSSNCITSQGSNSVALGNQAVANQGYNSIVINATATNIGNGSNNATFVAPIRETTNTLTTSSQSNQAHLFFNPTIKEVYRVPFYHATDDTGSGISAMSGDMTIMSIASVPAGIYFIYAQAGVIHTTNGAGNRRVCLEIQESGPVNKKTSCLTVFSNDNNVPNWNINITDIREISSATTIEANFFASDTVGVAGSQYSYMIIYRIA